MGEGGVDGGAGEDEEACEVEPGEEEEDGAEEAEGFVSGGLLRVGSKPDVEQEPTGGCKEGAGEDLFEGDGDGWHDAVEGEEEGYDDGHRCEPSGEALEGKVGQEGVAEDDLEGDEEEDGQEDGGERGERVGGLFDDAGVGLALVDGVEGEVDGAEDAEPAPEEGEGAKERGAALPGGGFKRVADDLFAGLSKVGLESVDDAVGDGLPVEEGSDRKREQDHGEEAKEGEEGDTGGDELNVLCFEGAVGVFGGVDGLAGRHRGRPRCSWLGAWYARRV